MNAIASADLRKKAKKSIDKADDTTVKMILAMLEVQEKEYNEESTVDKEIGLRFREYEQGKITPITLDELESRARKSYAERKKTLK